MKFSTELKYTSREDKMAYVYDKYKDILVDSVLDIGADNCLLQKELPKNVQYKGIGFGNNDDLISVDLEKEAIPFEENSFHTVVCLDVLEHLENIHEVTDKLFSIASKYVLLSLPNPYADFFNYMKSGKYMGREKDMKFYGLTHEREPDRHKWFFSRSDAIDFVDFKAKKNGYKVIDFQNEVDELFGSSLREKLYKYFFKKMFHNSLKPSDLIAGTIWWVLESE